MEFVKCECGTPSAPTKAGKHSESARHEFSEHVRREADFYTDQIEELSFKIDEGFDKGIPRLKSEVMYKVSTTLRGCMMKK